MAAVLSQAVNGHRVRIARAGRKTIRCTGRRFRRASSLIGDDYALDFTPGLDGFAAPVAQAEHRIRFRIELLERLTLKAGTVPAMSHFVWLSSITATSFRSRLVRHCLYWPVGLSMQITDNSAAWRFAPAADRFCEPHRALTRRAPFLHGPAALLVQKLATQHCRCTAAAPIPADRETKGRIPAAPSTAAPSGDACNSIARTSFSGRIGRRPIYDRASQTAAPTATSAAFTTGSPAACDPEPGFEINVTEQLARWFSESLRRH